jgi:hypothetical protein
MVVFQKQGMGVLVNFPDPAQLARELGSVGRRSDAPALEESPR